MVVEVMQLRPEDTLDKPSGCRSPACPAAGHGLASNPTRDSDRRQTPL
jgi:hypothetical protein